MGAPTAVVVTEVQKPVIVKATEYEKPEQGLHTARITLIEDKGMVKNARDGKMNHQVKFTFLITDQKSSKDEDLTITRTFNVAFGDQSHLGKFLRQIGVDTKNAASSGIDLAELVGLDLNAMIEYNQVGDKTYANVGSVTVLKKKTLKTAATTEI